MCTVVTADMSLTMVGNVSELCHLIPKLGHYSRASLGWRAVCTGITEQSDEVTIARPRPRVGERSDEIARPSVGGRSARWDPCSGQFSFTQTTQLQGAMEVVREMVVTNPGSVAVIWRQDKPYREHMVTYSQLSEMVDKVVDILKTGDKTTPVQGTLIYLPVSVLAVAVILACTSLQHRHTLVFAGFSSSALSSLLMSGQVDTVVTSQTWPVLTQTLHTALDRWTGPTITTRYVGNNSDLEMAGNLPDCPSKELSPLFALYTGGETSVIAGVGEMAGYYQVSSNVGLADKEFITAGEGGGQIQEQTFKEGKRNNTYRLDYINKILQSK